MIIEVKDIPVNIKKIVLEFDDGSCSNTILETNSENLKEIKKRNSTKVDKIENTEPKLDLSFGSNSNTEVSNEVIEKPKIPDKKRETKIAGTMQNLKI